MKKTRRTILALIGASLFSPALAQQPEQSPEQARAAEGQAKVQIAILLDTSGSMNGLIEQTKTQLWKVVNTFIGAKQNGQVPFVEVALYQYGMNGNAPHFIRAIQPLTRDLDQISEDLFALSTNGGS